MSYVPTEHERAVNSEVLYKWKLFLLCTEQNTICYNVLCLKLT